MLLHLSVKPNQRSNRLERSGASWQVRLAAPAVDGKANEALVAYLSDCLDIPKSKITLKKGHTSRFKVLEVVGDPELILAKLEQAAAAY